MKKRLLSILMALSMCLSLLPTAAFAKDTTVSTSDEFLNAIANANNGDTITISTDNGNGISIPYADTSGDDPLVISKEVTITGESLTISRGGIVLGADVTFENINIAFINAVRNAIIANGYALTLNGVKGTGTYPVHLFCGGVTDSTTITAALPDTGSSGQIVIEGSNTLGDIYAGSLSDVSDNSVVSNVYNGSATITMSSGANGVGGIYAHGAREPRGTGDGKNMTPDSANYKVTGDVTINLSNTTATVDGATGGNSNATVNFNAANGNQALHTLTNIGALHLSGSEAFLAPTSGTIDAGAAVSVPAGTTLNLTSLTNTNSQDTDNLTIGSLTGGGTLLLGGSKTLTITGAVSGTTSVNYGGTVTEGNTYITAANSASDSFTLANSGYTLKRDDSGNWKAVKVVVTDAPVVKPDSFEIAEDDAKHIMTAAEMDGNGLTVPVDCTLGDEDFFTDIPLTITIGKDGGTAVSAGRDYVVNYGYEYSIDALGFTGIYVDETTASIFFESSGIAAGVYTIEISVTLASGETVTRTIILTVTDSSDNTCDHSNGTKTYTASGSVITESCGDCDSAIGTATISATDGTYNGTAYSATVAGSGTLDGQTWTITYTSTTQSGENYNSTTAPTNAGSYTASITAGEGNDAVTASVEYTIAPKTVNSPIITLEYDSCEYTGDVMEPAVTSVKDGEDEIPASEYTVEYNNNTDAGMATVTIKDKDGGNYTVSGSTTFEITKVSQADFSIAGKPAAVTYGDTFLLGYDGGSVNGAVTWSVSGSATVDETTNTVTITGVDETTITVKKAGNTNYQEATDTWTFTPAKKAVTASVMAQDKTYDGTTDATIAATVTNGLVGSDTLTIIGLTGTFFDANAGENKTVTIDSSNVSVEGTNADCYNVSFPTTVTATISKVTSNVAFNNYVPNKTYDTTALTNPTENQLSITGASYDDVVFTWYKGSVDEANKLDAAPSDAGTYYVVASIPKSDNTSGSTAISDAITISPKEVTNPTITLEKTSYGYSNGAEIKPTVVSVKDGNDVILVGEYTVEYSNNTNVGMAIVTIKDKDGGNYTVSGSTTFQITKVPQAELSITNQQTSPAYGSTFQLDTSGGSGDGAVTWSYTGTASVDSSGNVTITGVGDFTITATKAGGSSYDDITASYSGTSVQADPGIGTVSYSGNTLYNSMAISAVVLTRANTTVGGTLALTDTELIVGEKAYNWKFTPTDTTNYKTITGTVTLNVQEDTLQSISTSGTLNKSAYTYGDTFSIDGLTVTATYASGATKYVTSLVNYNNSLVTGQTSVELSYEGKTCTVSITVSKATPSVTAPTAKTSLTYNGVAQELVTAGSTTGGTMQYSLDNSTWSTSIPTGTDAKTYTIYYKVVGGDNYEDVAAQTVSVTIEKADPTFTVPTSLTATYGQTLGNVSLPTATGGTWTWTNGESTSVGDAGTQSHNATFTPGDTANYHVKTIAVTVTVEAASITGATVTVDTNADLTYTGSAIKPAVTVTLNGSTLDAANYDAAYTNNTNVGTAIVTVTGKGNYKNSASANFTIIKATPTVTAPTAKTGLTYNGAAQKLVTAGSTTGGTIQYSLDQSTWDTTIPEAANAKTYTVYYKVVGGDNYEDVAAQTVSVTIAPKTVSSPTITLEYDSYVYTGSAIEPAVIVKDGKDVIPNSEYTVVYENNTDVGTATVKIVDVNGGNYTVSGSKTFEITKVSQATLSIIGKPDTITYGDTFPLSYDGGSGNGAVTWLVTGSATVDASTGVVKITGVDETTITVTKAGDTNYQEATDIWTFTPAKKAVMASVTAQDKTYDSNTTAIVTAGVANTDLVSGDSITISGLTGTFSDANAGENKTVTINSSSVSVTGTNTNCYNVRFPASVPATISPKTVSSPTITLEHDSYVYTGSAIEPAVIVKDGDDVIPDNEYTVEYSNNINVGMATVTIKDKDGGNYTVNDSKTFEIVDHSHEWNYTASGAVISAKCVGTIGTCPMANQTVTITLTAPAGDALVYDGNAKTVTVTQSPTDIFTDLPAVSYSGDCISVGEHTASLTYGGVTANISFTIVKADQPVPTDLSLSHSYILLQAEASAVLTAKVTPSSLASSIQWSSSDENIVTVTNGGKVKAEKAGTAYVSATVIIGDDVYSARCRVDVTAAATLAEAVEAVHLTTTKVTSYIHSSNYARFDVLFNMKKETTAETSVDWSNGETDNNGVSITNAKFADSAVAKLFTLNVVDDRTLEIQPIDPSKITKNSTYKSAVIVTISDGEIEKDLTLTTSEKLTISANVKEPTVKAAAVKLNTFFAGATAPLVFTCSDGEVTGVVEDKAKGELDWLTLDEEKMTVTSTEQKKNSGKLYLKATVSGYEGMFPVTASVSATVTKPKVKLSASSVTFAETNSKGMALSLISSNKKTAYTNLGVTGLTVADANSSYEVVGFKSETGAFTLKVKDDISAAVKEKVLLKVTFGDDSNTMTLPLTVKVSRKEPTIKLSKSSITLNRSLGRGIDSYQIAVTVTPADYNFGKFEITAEDKQKNPVEIGEQGDLNVTINGNILTVTTTEKTQENTTYKVKVGFQGVKKEATLTVKISKAKAPTVKLTAKGSIDTSRMSSGSIILTPKYTNFNVYGNVKEEFKVMTGSENVTSKFNIDDNHDGTFTLTVKDDVKLDAKLKYEVSMTALDGNNKTIASTSKGTKLSIKQGTVKVTQDVKSIQLFDIDSYGEGIVILSIADKSVMDIDDVTIQNAESSPFDIDYLGNGKCVIGFRNNVVAGTVKKSNTVKLQVWLKSNGGEKANATVSVKVAVSMLK